LLPPPDVLPGLLLELLELLELPGTLEVLPLLPPDDEGCDGNGDSLPPLDELLLVLVLVLPPWVCGNGDGCEGDDDPGEGADGG
jgi:hypothetical protein